MTPTMKKSLTAVLCALSLAAPPAFAEEAPTAEPKLAPFVWAAVSAAGQATSGLYMANSPSGLVFQAQSCSE